MTDQVEIESDGSDWYAAHLAAIDRTPEMDVRISVHEASHALASRLLGLPVGGMTCDPGEGFGGRVWGPKRSVAFRRDGEPEPHGVDDVPALCDQLRDMMPKDAR